MKLFHKILLWMALPFGIVMTIVCLTGALLVIEKPVTTLIDPDFYTVKVEEPAPEPAHTTPAFAGNPARGCPEPRKAGQSPGQSRCNQS